MLVAGGTNLNGFSTKTTEIYDPATGTWTLTQNMLTMRETPFDPILLSDGKVLAAGGNDQNAVNCELYDPAAGKWSITGSLNEGRWLFGATKLNDGRVLVAGGYPNGHTPGFVPDSELYDPVSGSWSLSGALNRGRAGHVQELLADGRVLIAGGFAGVPSVSLVTNTAEIFVDFATGSINAPLDDSTREQDPAVRQQGGGVGGTGINQGSTVIAASHLNSAETYGSEKKEHISSYHTLGKGNGREW